MTGDLGGHILLLSGHPGSGKSTIAEALAHLPGVPKVHFHSDDLWGYIKHGRIDPWLPQSHQQNRMIMQIAADVAGRYAGLCRPFTSFVTVKLSGTLLAGFRGNWIRLWRHVASNRQTRLLICSATRSATMTSCSGCRSVPLHDGRDAED